jgi:hypothetical protein
MMTLLDRLKPEYKDKLNDQTIKILSTHEYYIDLKVLDAQIICVDLTGKSLDLSSLLGLFYAIKEMKS